MTARHDSYRHAARHYDLHGWDWFARIEGARLIALLAEHGIEPGASVLDAGCGTGSLALMLARAGYRVAGVDSSPEMIGQARAKDASAEVDWRVGDVTDLAYGDSFDAVVSVADVLNHLESLNAWTAALTSFRAALRPGGLVCVDVMTCRGLEQMDVQSVQARGDVTLILAVLYDPAARRSTLKIISFVPAQGGLYERVQETITEWGHPVAGILSCFTRAGYIGIERVWTTTDDPEGEDRLVVLARR